ncbi:endolytic transglycosylase MltG [Flavobacterium okayamense]|uniref:Endolytic murein transglycosylase n=1 Tax=Flavobacterium okayamense TaxID=2830782 RepID=A0ABM7S2B8_9FLAO|nr:endolytic transglycosylase MltG [Flavobacterium okayamense]BCY27138.1 aminodeoxychorismate lyase [Flavobacterium okayamense]
MNLKKLIAIIAVSGIVIAGIIAAYIYTKAFTPNTTFNQKEVFVYIPTDATYEQAKEELSPFIKDMDKFDFVANQRKYSSNVKAGKFLLKKEMTSFDMIRALRSNIPVKVSFNNQESIEKLAQRLAAELEPDSLQLVQAFTNEKFLTKNEINQDNALSLFIPNSYEFYWNTSAETLADKLAKEYRKFWTDARKLKAQNLNLTPLQVSVLASIVQKETAKVSERPRVAGVYLNRLKTGMPLQADPTVIYAIKKLSGDFDQVIKRVLHADLVIDSPYNTYKYPGLPPGPITMPDISSIDAVLNAEKHDYLYFCASPDKPGFHAFASNYEQHMINARKYANWVNKLGINR